MQKIIDPISRELIKLELNAERFLRKTRKGDNEMSIESSFNTELEILEEEYAEGLIDQKTYNKRLESLEKERREAEE